MCFCIFAFLNFEEYVMKVAQPFTLGYQVLTQRYNLEYFFFLRVIAFKIYNIYMGFKK